MWECILAIPNKKTNQIENALCGLPYIKHKGNTFIRCQANAWMDTAGIAMTLWLDVQIEPHFAAKLKNARLVWVDCDSHNCYSLCSL